MGKAKWWVCDDCKSLNDLPANKCYKCHTGKPHDPSLMDDQYGHVGGGESQRVGVTVDLSRVGDLTAPDPIETAEGGGFVEAYQAAEGGGSVEAGQTPRGVGLVKTYGYDDDKPLASTSIDSTPAAKPPPLREPTPRSISQLTSRHWTDGLDPIPTTAAPPPGPPAPSEAGPPPEEVVPPSHPPPLAPLPSPVVETSGRAGD